MTPNSTTPKMSALAPRQILTDARRFSGPQYAPQRPNRAVASVQFISRERETRFRGEIVDSWKEFGKLQTGSSLAAASTWLGYGGFSCAWPSARF